MSVTYVMHLDACFFELFETGCKTIELRLWDQKRSCLRVGDVIRFENRADPKRIWEGRITQLYRARNFEELLDLFPIEQTGFDSKNSLLESLTLLYSQPEQERLGVVGIALKLLA